MLSLYCTLEDTVGHIATLEQIHDRWKLSGNSTENYPQMLMWANCQNIMTSMIHDLKYFVSTERKRDTTSRRTQLQVESPRVSQLLKLAAPLWKHIQRENRSPSRMLRDIPVFSATWLSRGARRKRRVAVWTFPPLLFLLVFSFFMWNILWVYAFCSDPVCLLFNLTMQVKLLLGSVVGGAYEAVLYKSPIVRWLRVSSVTPFRKMGWKVMRDNRAATAVQLGRNSTPADRASWLSTKGFFLCFLIWFNGSGRA